MHASFDIQVSLLRSSTEVNLNRFQSLLLKDMHSSYLLLEEEDHQNLVSFLNYKSIIYTTHKLYSVHQFNNYIQILFIELFPFPSQIQWVKEMRHCIWQLYLKSYFTNNLYMANSLHTLLTSKCQSMIQTNTVQMRITPPTLSHANAHREELWTLKKGSRKALQ